MRTVSYVKRRRDDNHWSYRSIKKFMSNNLKNTHSSLNLEETRKNTKTKKLASK